MNCLFVCCPRGYNDICVLFYPPTPFCSTTASIVDNRPHLVSDNEQSNDEELKYFNDGGWEEHKQETPTQTRSDVIEPELSSSDEGESEDEAWKEVTPMPARWLVTPKRWKITPQRMENDVKNSCASSVDIIANEKFYQNAFITDVMSEKDYSKTVDGVEVKNSSLHGSGVFTTKALKPGFLTAYPGVKRLTQNPLGAEDDRLSMHEDYTVQVSNGFFFDATDIGVNSAQIGHLLNTSHPKQEAVYSAPNCSYVSILVVCEDGTKEIRPAVYVDKPVEAGVELLCDYHWRLAALLECDCEEEACVEAREEDKQKRSIVNPAYTTSHETPVQKLSLATRTMDFLSPSDQMMLPDSPVCADAVISSPSPTSITPINRNKYESSSYSNRRVRGRTLKARQSQLMR